MSEQFEKPHKNLLIFHQCSNPNCKLRFPAPVLAPTETRLCPRCKSITQLVPNREQVERHNPRISSAVNQPHLEVLLDNIRSTFNVGAMLRTSDGAGVKHVHLCGITPLPDNPRVTKVSLGAEFSIPWTYHPNGVEAVTDCKNRGFQVWSLEIHPEAVSVFETEPQESDGPVLLIVGNEVSGIDPAIEALCDRFFWIPMHGYKRSLNVAVAFGIAVYSLQHRTTLSKIELDLPIK